MRPPKLGTLFALAACLSLTAVPAFATPDIGQKDNGFSITDETYLRTYEKCWKAFGEDCDRNLLDSAWKDTEPVSEARIKAATARMDGWLNPPVAPEPVASSSTEYVAPAPVTSSVPASSAGGCPSYMAAEADSPSDVNPTSGAAGCYQILPSTAAANGCSDVGPDCAARICASQGPSAWAASGADPCPYVQP